MPRTPATRSAREPLERIARAGKHLLQLINEVLDLSKIEAGKLEINYEPVAVASLVGDVVGEAEPLAAKNGNRLVVDCAARHRHRSAPIRLRLRQIMLNLLSNACKFTEKGTVSLSVCRSRANGDDWISIRVVDTGIGMTRNSSAGCSRNSARPTARRRGNTAALDWASRSATACAA